MKHINKHDRDIHARFTDTWTIIPHNAIVECSEEVGSRLGLTVVVEETAKPVVVVEPKKVKK